jgi:pyocin large subunit-like protein
MLDESAREDLIEKITAIFTNEADASEFNEDPDAWVEEHLPEGTEGADVASCLPEVGYRSGLDFSNVASTGGHAASPAGHISHTYQTIYQQNSFIYAEEGSQVTNIQGDGNAVAQQDVDVDIDVDYGHGDEDTEELPEEATPEVPEGEDAPDPAVTTTVEDLTEVDPHEGSESDGWNGEWDEPQIDLEFENHADAGPAEAPVEEAPEAPAPDVDPVDA